MQKIEKIATYTISRLQKIFEQAGEKKDFLFIDEDRYAPSMDEPFRTDTYAIAFIKNGSLLVTTGLNQQVVTGPSLVTIGPSIIRSIEREDANPRVDLLFFQESFFLEDSANIFSLQKYTFFEDSDAHILPLTAAATKKFETLYALLKEMLAGSDPAQFTPHPHENVILRNYIHIILSEIAALSGEQQAQRQTQPCQKLTGFSPLLTEFKTLLTREIYHERSVRFYAGQLHVTPKHLSELIKAHTGRTAGEWIDQTVVLEAKVLLQKKELSISQVADALNFPDQSVFGKFFKVNAGLSPLHYRNSLD